MAIVLFLDRNFALKRLVRTLLLVPIIMTPVVVGLTWRFIFDPSSGMANYLLSRLGIDAMDWLGSPQVALYSVLIADIWQWTPFVILLVDGGARIRRRPIRWMPPASTARANGRSPGMCCCRCCAAPSPSSR